MFDDQTRCTGQPIGGAWVCPSREGCERYRVFKAFSDSQEGLGIGKRKPHRGPLISVAIINPSQPCDLMLEARK